MGKPVEVRRIRKKPLAELDLATITDFVLTPEDREDFQEGIRLFNQERFWEAHESWEAVWLRHPEDGRYFVQGLIQLAAGYHQLRRRIYRGFVIHLGRAGDRLALFPDTFLSVDVAGLRETIRQSLHRMDSPAGAAGTHCSDIVVPRIRLVGGEDAVAGESENAAFDG